MTISAFAPHPGGSLTDAVAVKVAEWRTPRRRATDVPDLPWLDEILPQFDRLFRSSVGPGPHVAMPAIRAALQLLGRVMAHDSIAPTVVPRFNGGIQLEWHSLGVDLEIEIEPNGAASAWCEDAAGREWEDDGEIKIGRLKKELSVLVRHG